MRSNRRECVREVIIEPDEDIGYAEFRKILRKIVDELPRKEDTGEVGRRGAASISGSGEHAGQRPRRETVPRKGFSNHPLGGSQKPLNVFDQL